MTIANPPSSPVVDLDELVSRGPTAPAPVRAPASSGQGLGTRVRRLVTLEHVLVAVTAAAVGAGIALRFITHSSLWLDEALTVNISRLPLSHLFAALRQDGSPPAYYLLLHYWMGLFGTGDTSVRTLPAIMSLVTVPAAWVLGRSVGGRQVAWVTTVFVATSPFAIRYGSENRMYSMVMLLTTLGGIALVRCLRDATPRRLVAVGVTTGLLLLTHYWALYLVAATGGVLLLASLRGTNKAASRLTLAAMAAGSLMFVPWAPSFLFQAAHTGTPWATAPSPFMLIEAVGQFTGWDTNLGIPLFVLYCVLFGSLIILVTVSTVPSARRAAVRLGLRSQVPGERWAGPLAAVALGALTLAFAGGLLSGAAFAYRYASVVLVPTAMLAAMGATAVGVTWGGRRLQAGLVAAVALIGVPVGAHVSLANRTEATVVAADIRAVAHPGDVIVYCPDQLGPAVSRLLPRRYLQVTFPRFDAPELINWVDYAQVNAQAPAPGVMAQDLVNLAGPDHQVWLIWEAGYRTLGRNCEQLRDSLVALRPNFSEPVRSHPERYYEHESLDRFAPA